MENIDKRLKAYGIGRFQVMALLQAARYYVLKGDLEKAKSFGLNRAIFYAWAKYYGPARNPVARLSRVEEILRKQTLRGIKPSKCPEGYVNVLGECVKTGPRGYYSIGEQEQLPVDFDHQVLRKIKPLIDPDKAWKAAVEYVSRFPRKILENPSLFYKYVYEPVRDFFFTELIRKGRVEPPREIIERLDSLNKMIEEARRKQRSITDFFNAA